MDFFHRSIHKSNIHPGAPMTPHLVDIPVLETERLILRGPEARDFEQIKPFVMSDRARFVGGGEDADEGRAWRILAIITGHWHLRGYGTFVAESKTTGQAIGSLGPWHPGHWPERELGWTIWNPEAEGTGLAFEAMICARRHAYQDLGWETAVSYIAPDNTRSQTLAKRLGCTLDETADRPGPDDLVFRHPSPAEVLA